MQANRVGIVAATAAAASRPVLWLVGVGMVLCMCLVPATRQRGRAQIAKWGGWPGLPGAAWRWAGAGLRAWPYAVVAAAGLPVLVSVLLSWSFAYVPLVLIVALLTAMIAPSVNDEIAARLIEPRARHGERRE